MTTGRKQDWQVKRTYDEDDATFSADAYTVDRYAGIAWYVMGWETAADEDTEWSGIRERTGNVVAIMIGDDQHFTFAPEDITPIEREAYCGDCGQVGCRSNNAG